MFLFKTGHRILRSRIWQLNESVSGDNLHRSTSGVWKYTCGSADPWEFTLVACEFDTVRFLRIEMMLYISLRSNYAQYGWASYGTQETTISSLHLLFLTDDIFIPVLHPELRDLSRSEGRRDASVWNCRPRTLNSLAACPVSGYHSCLLWSAAVVPRTWIPLMTVPIAISLLMKFAATAPHGLPTCRRWRMNPPAN